jgi:hypothetical protein
MALGHRLFGIDLIRVRQAKISLEAAMKPTREMMFAIEFLLASRTV